MADPQSVVHVVTEKTFQWEGRFLVAGEHNQMTREDLERLKKAIPGVAVKISRDEKALCGPLHKKDAAACVHMEG